jgi:single-stranded-DNA-specific exonuclease
MAVKITARPIPDIAHELVDLNPTLQKIYLARGVSKLAELEKDLKNLYSYKLLSNITSAADLIYKHLVNKNKMLIIGDFDSDGATSTALAVDFFRKINANINYLVPNRFEYGYGLSVELVELASKNNPDLLITVDSGIACLKGVAAAKEKNIEVLITDHHIPGIELPIADVIVNPNLKDDMFPSKNLAGVGVIFYVLLALRAKLREENWFVKNNVAEINMAQFLDLVALGTVADVVPLDYNNRILVAQGLNRIRSGECRIGIKALLKIAKRNHQNIVASDLGFAVGPRLNAAGRLDDMSLGIECLLADDPLISLSIAENLDALNYERKAIERDMKTEAIDIIKKLNLDNNNLPVAFCLYQENWHQGVIGIVAARIKELYHRPVVVFADDGLSNNQYIKASCRSIDGVNIRDVLQNVAVNNPGLLVKFGGHAMAAGLSLKKADFAKFTEVFTAEVNKLLDADKIHGVYTTDGELDFNFLNQDLLNLAKLLKNAEPWGQKFPEPCFSGEFIVVDQRIVGEIHLSLKLKIINQTETDNFTGANISSTIDGIIFNCAEAEWFNKKLSRVKIVYKLDINVYNNTSRVQLLIDYLECC